jgi:D-sedoheptulose 7-phosphate isomerase
MSLNSIDAIRQIFTDSIAAHERFAPQGAARVAVAAEVIATALLAGQKVLAFGNGGSASDAEHLVAELVGRFEGERRALPAIALTADSSVVTAISNDYGYDQVFARQVEGLGARGDVAFGISTSGRSKNVETALATAKAGGLITIAMTGRDGGRMGADADIHLNVPEQATPRIQEVHRTIMHAVCSALEARLKTANAGR